MTILVGATYLLCVCVFFFFFAGAEMGLLVAKKSMRGGHGRLICDRKKS